MATVPINGPTSAKRAVILEGSSGSVNLQHVQTVERVQNQETTAAIIKKEQSCHAIPTAHADKPHLTSHYPA